MSIGKILFITGLTILALCVATVMLFFAIAFVLSWSYTLFGFVGPIAVIASAWLIAFLIKTPL